MCGWARRFERIVAHLAFDGAGVLARQHLVGLRSVNLVGFLGVATADWIIYWVGRRYGQDIVAHPSLAARSLSFRSQV